jgi:hypothetical protein
LWLSSFPPPQTFAATSGRFGGRDLLGAEDPARDQGCRCGVVKASASSTGVTRVVGSVVLVEEGYPGGRSSGASAFVSASHPAQLCVPPAPRAALDVVAGSSRLEVAGCDELHSYLVAVVEFGPVPSDRCSGAETMPDETSKGSVDVDE